MITLQLIKESKGDMGKGMCTLMMNQRDDDEYVWLVMIYYERKVDDDASYPTKMLMTGHRDAWWTVWTVGRGWRKKIWGRSSSSSRGLEEEWGECEKIVKKNEGGRRFFYTFFGMDDTKDTPRMTKYFRPPVDISVKCERIACILHHTSVNILNLNFHFRVFEWLRVPWIFTFSSTFS